VFVERGISKNISTDSSAKLAAPFTEKAMAGSHQINIHARIIVNPPSHPYINRFHDKPQRPNRGISISVAYIRLWTRHFVATFQHVHSAHRASK
jgi:hypothetical protein